MAKKPDEVEHGQASANEDGPSDFRAEKNLREFLHHLGRLSTQYGLWIESTPLGTTVSPRSDALGYRARARTGAGQGRIYMIDCRGPGDAYGAEGYTPEGQRIITGGDQAKSCPTGSGSEETVSTHDESTVQAALDRHLQELEPEKLSFYPLDPVGDRVPHQACYAGRPIPGLILGIADDGSHRMQALQVLQQMRRNGEFASLLNESSAS